LLDQTKDFGLTEIHEDGKDQPRPVARANTILAVIFVDPYMSDTGSHGAMQTSGGKRS